MLGSVQTLGVSSDDMASETAGIEQVFSNAIVGRLRLLQCGVFFEIE